MIFKSSAAVHLSLYSMSGVVLPVNDVVNPRQKARTRKPRNNNNAHANSNIITRQRRLTAAELTMQSSNHTIQNKSHFKCPPKASITQSLRSSRSGPYGQCVRSPPRVLGLGSLAGDRGCFFFAYIAEMLILRMLKTI